MSPTESFTKIPNVLIDTWLPILPASEFAVLICVVRFTRGFHRGEIDMGMRLISTRTGLNKETVSLAVRALKVRGLITCTPGFRGRITYELHLDVKPNECTENPDTQHHTDTIPRDSECTENPDSECTEIPYSSVRKIRTRERNIIKRKKGKKGFPEQFGGTHQSATSGKAGACDASKITAPSETTPKPLISSKSDDDENTKPPARERLRNPEAEFLERLRERGHATGVNAEHVLKSVRKQLDKRALRLNTFLDYESGKANGRVRNPAGMYTQLVREWDADAFQQQTELTRELTQKTVIEVKAAVNDCPHCANSSLGKGGIVNEAGGFEACPCSPNLAGMIAQMEQQRKDRAA